ncbi:MAG: hypothetical protein IKQ87_03580, partial [Clostridia bacterium]|nr:hypothetical protein [Clostridia bacterium]
FDEIYSTGYLPHTFKEFLGTDPIEPASVTIGVDSPTVSVDTLTAQTLTANYVVSDVFCDITDPDGKVLLHYVKRLGNHFSRSAKMADCIPAGVAKTYQTAGVNTVTITCQLGTGELVTVYTGTLA